MVKLFRNLVSYDRKELESFELDEVTYHSDLTHNPEFMLGLAFGNSRAPCTENLARAVNHAHTAFELLIPVIAQKAILDNCGFYGIFDDFWSIDTTTKGNAPGEVSLSSYEALEAAREIVDKENYDPSKALYIAHPAHMERVIQISEKLGFRGVPFLESRVSWNTDVNDATSSPEKWLGREVLTRIHHRLKGYI